MLLLMLWVFFGMEELPIGPKEVVIVSWDANGIDHECSCSDQGLG